MFISAAIAIDLEAGVRAGELDSTMSASVDLLIFVMMCLAMGLGLEFGIQVWRITAATPRLF